MRGGHHSYVNRDWFVAADALDFTLLQHAQKRNLYFGRQVADFVQEDCPVARRLKTPKAPLRRTSEGTFLVAEELRSNQRWRDCGAIHPDKCSRRTTRSLMNSASDQLLSRTGFTQN